jgi:serine protease Do
MTRARGRQAGTFLLLAGAVAFGIVLAGALEPGARGLASPAAAAAESRPVPSSISASGLPSFADLAEQVLPAVVSIDAQQIQRTPTMRRRGQENPFDFFFGPRQQPEGGGGEPREFRSSSGGSGFVVSRDGFVVTNHHVIENATKIRVRLEERWYEAELKGADPATDLALLKIDAGRELSVLPLGDSDLLRVGDFVMAIGSPLLLDHTVTVGVVSAKGRSIGLTRDSSFENFIQTDAAINRGNSGGPLVNLRGEVVGIATAMNWGAENIGFAVPVNTLQMVLPQLREKGRVSRGYLGVNIQNLDWERAQAFGLDDPSGALVTTVVPDSPASAAGVRHGDVVVAVDGRRVRETRDLIDYVSAQGPGKKVALELLRGGKKVRVDVQLAERQLADEAATTGPEESSPGIDWLGLDYQDLTPALRQGLRIPDRVEGVVLRAVAASSPLYDEGLASGDVIVEVNGRATPSVGQFEREVASVPSGAYLRFYVQRFDPRGSGDAVSFFAIVRVP